MQRLILFLILILVTTAHSAEDAKIKKQRETAARVAAAKASNSTILPPGPDKALVDLAEKCEKATREINGNINKGLSSCSDRQAVKDDGLQRTADETLAAMKGPVQGYNTPKAPERPKLKEPTEEVTDANGNRFRVSVVTSDEAEAIHQNILKGRHDFLRLGYPDDGCQQRAQLIASDLEDQGIGVGKIWSEPGFAAFLNYGRINPRVNGEAERRAGWKFHVAPFILVKKNPLDPKEVAEKWILDPSFNRNKPLPLETYRNDLSDSPRWMASQTITSPYIYTQNETYKNRTQFRTEDLIHARSAIQNIRKKGRNDGVWADTLAPN